MDSETAPLSGTSLPSLRTPVPGPASRVLAARLARVESANITRLEPVAPIFWAKARGANVQDADNNIFIDLTAGFSVAATGHANPAVADAIAEQAGTLPHGLGDVHPSGLKVRLLEKLAAITPGELGISILGSAGAEAVEAALKTAMIRTGRPGLIAFDGAYHGLTFGALSVTHRADFRAPFESRLYSGVRFAPYPETPTELKAALATVRAAFREQERAGTPVGAIIVEPIQGRGGIRVPPDGFLAGLRELCDGNDCLLIFDEIYSGMGRTGRWFACEHWGVTPDVLTLGKALTGSVPVSAAVGTPNAMIGWPPSHGEAIHTSTFLGNPIGCAAALAQIQVIETDHLLDRASEIGSAVQDRVAHWSRKWPGLVRGRGIGALQGVVLPPGVAVQIADAALEKGVIVLCEGPTLDVLALTPPLTITPAQLQHSLDVLEFCLLASM